MEENIITKAKISSASLSFEFEGTESFVREQIKDVIQNLNADSNNQKIQTPIKVENTETKKQGQSIGSKNTEHRKATNAEPKVIDNLLPDTQKINDLKTFYTSKKPSGHLENFVVISYWLKENNNMDLVTIDEIYTCYRLLGIKPPKVAIQVFRDAKSKKMWFTSGEKNGQYRISVNGITAVEHDIPSSNK